MVVELDSFFDEVSIEVKLYLSSALLPLVTITWNFALLINDYIMTSIRAQFTRISLN